MIMTSLVIILPVEGKAVPIIGDRIVVVSRTTQRDRLRWLITQHLVRAPNLRAVASGPAGPVLAGPLFCN